METATFPYRKEISYAFPKKELSDESARATAIFGGIALIVLP